MCTLTYIPTDHGYIFTHNRDERMDRPTSKDFRKQKSGEQVLYFPQDLEAKGSWIAFSSKGKSACLLNGGSMAHARKEKYRKSRGLVVLESFDFKDTKAFYKNYNFDNIEPFTLIVGDLYELVKIVHDENETTFEILDKTVSNIWSSTTLYTIEVRKKREQWFKNWLLKNHSLNASQAFDFHRNAGDGDHENDLVMSRWGMLKTLSITQISVAKNQASLSYHDFIQSTVDQTKIML